MALKGRYVDMLDAIAKKLNVDPSEAFGHIVGRAHKEMFGSAAGQNAKPKSDAKQSEPAPSGDSSVKGTGQDALEQVGEPHDGHDLEDSSNEHRDAPNATGAPNPLAIKRWASVKGEDEEDERQRSVAKPRQVLARGKTQR